MNLSVGIWCFLTWMTLYLLHILKDSFLAAYLVATPLSCRLSLFLDAHHILVSRDLYDHINGTRDQCAKYLKHFCNQISMKASTLR